MSVKLHVVYEIPSKFIPIQDDIKDGGFGLVFLREAIAKGFGFVCFQILLQCERVKIGFGLLYNELL